jgi:hypothetical protein
MVVPATGLDVSSLSRQSECCWYHWATSRESNPLLRLLQPSIWSQSEFPSFFSVPLSEPLARLDELDHVYDLLWFMTCQHSSTSGQCCNILRDMTGNEATARTHGTVESILLALAISIAPAENGDRNMVCFSGGD